MVKDIQTIGRNGSSYPNELRKFGSRLFFKAEDAAAGVELWMSNGTSIGTTRVTDINSGPRDSGLGHLAFLGKYLYFSASDAAHERGLWTSDGTTSGTRLLKATSNTQVFTSWNGFVFFAASDKGGRELWKTDGTSSGTIRVKDIRPGSEGSSINAITKGKDAIFFVANNGKTGSELWRVMEHNPEQC